MFLIFRGKNRILLVSESGIKFKSGNWLHFQCVETQWVEEEKAAVDTKMDNTLTVTPALFQNVAAVMSQAANATDSHFTTIKSYEAGESIDLYNNYGT